MISSRERKVSPPERVSPLIPQEVKEAKGLVDVEKIENPLSKQITAEQFARITGQGVDDAARASKFQKTIDRLKKVKEDEAKLREISADMKSYKNPFLDNTAETIGSDGINYEKEIPDLYLEDIRNQGINTRGISTDTAPGVSIETIQQATEQSTAEVLAGTSNKDGVYKKEDSIQEIMRVAQDRLASAPTTGADRDVAVLNLKKEVATMVKIKKAEQDLSDLEFEKKDLETKMEKNELRVTKSGISEKEALDLQLERADLEKDTVDNQLDTAELKAEILSLREQLAQTSTVAARIAQTAQV